MKYNRKTNYQSRHCLGGRPGRRGSAIILVLVTIVLTALLATTLIQITRFERIAKADSNIEAVISSVVDQILLQGTDDLIDINGNMFNIIATANNANSAGDEPWDFPYTRNANYGRQAERIDGSSVNVLGGVADDAWLASPAPDFRTAAQIPTSSFASGGTTNTTMGVWRHITDLTGLYLTNSTGGSNLSTDAQPTERPITNLSAKTNLVALRADDASSVLVDSDGDGIGDAKWEWAPLRQIGTTRYVMAVRIVDLSSRIDLNVATGVDSSADGAPRGDGPTEMNGAYAAGQIGTAASVASATATTEWNTLLNFRLTGSSASAASTLSYDNNRADPTADSRRHFWERGASLVGPDFARNGESGTGFDYTNASTVTVTDAFELLHRNGLNNASNAPIESVMPTLLRGGAGEEDNFVTTAGGPVTANNWTVRQFWELDPRKMYSPFTGSMAVSRHPSVTYAAQPATYKFNLNWNRDNNKYFQWLPSALRNRWMNVASPSGSSSLRSLFPHLSSRTEHLPNQLALNIADYMDRDNRISINFNRAGFEALPYITEVYTQRPYDVRTLAIDPMTGERNVSWEPVANSTIGYAIEIGNPFAQRVGSTWVGRSISLENIWLKIGSAAPVLLTSLTGLPTDLELDPGEVLIVTRNSTGGNATLDDVSSRWATPSGNLTVAAAVTGPAMPLSANMTVSLHAMQQGTSTSNLSWYYSGCEIEAGNATVNETLPAVSTIVVGDQTYVQTGYQGVGDELRMMTVMPQPQSSNTRGFGDDTASLNTPSINHNEAAGTPDLDGTGTIPPEFTEQTKTGEPNGFSALDGQQIVWHDNPRNYPNDRTLPEDGRMMWTGDLLQIPIIGPNYRAGAAQDRTMARAFFDAGLNSNASGVDALLLPYKRTAPKMNSDTSTAIGGTFGLFNIPHSLMLLEQVTVNQPATDQEDGDGDGYNERRFDNTPQPDLDEMLVAGKINLNTASQATLERILPFPSAALRTNIAAAIVQRRESLTQLTDWGIGANNVPGIQYVGSLYEQVATVGSSPGTDGADNQAISGVPVDHNNFEGLAAGVITPSALADGVADDREEELMLTKWLHEVADVRSDVFAAYIIVQGYRADDFRQGAQESARLIVLFSRANVHGPGDQAMEIARFRIE